MEDHYKNISDPHEYGVDTDEESEIQKFYAGQTVFLTGCTGFVGKCVVEKLLRGCPDLKKLYLMVRPKKVSGRERIKKYFDDILFEKMREVCPDYQSKVIIVEGNLEKENLDLSEEDKKTVTNDSTIFFHNASNVKFEPRLQESFGCNIFGTKFMLDLAKLCKNLKVFVYISTAYSHCHQKDIYERNYQAPVDLKIIQDCIDVDNETPGGMKDAAKQAFIAPWPNVYTYGKATAENLVAEAAKEVSFRCCIFRPSVVLSTYREPIVGWVDNMNGPVMLFAGVALGLVHSGYMMDRPLDFIPADMCTNGLLATTWDAVMNRKETQTVLVYNYGTSTVNPMSILGMKHLCVESVKVYPSVKAVGPIFSYLPNFVIPFVLTFFLFHWIPGILADIALIATGKKPKVVSILYKVTTWLPTIDYFANGNWHIHVHETKKCWDRMNLRDQELFSNDLRTLDWGIYGFNYWLGLRVYLLKDPMSTVEQGRKRARFISMILHVLIAIIGLSFLYYFSEYLFLLLEPFHNLAKLSCPAFYKS